MIRPVFLARNFYGDDVKKGKRYHEIALYYLLDVSGRNSDIFSVFFPFVSSDSGTGIGLFL